MIELAHDVVQHTAFEHQLAATIAWSQLRMTTLRHSTPIAELFRSRPVERRHLIGPAALFREPRSVDVLLVEVRSFAEENLCDGASEAETEGFFDVDNAPPWDLWIDVVMVRDAPLLLSWIPRRYVELAQRGADVNPEGCIGFVSLLPK